MIVNLDEIRNAHEEFLDANERMLNDEEEFAGRFAEEYVQRGIL